MNNFPATSYDKWKIGDAQRELNEVELTDHEEWCECHIDGDENDCTCPEGKGVYYD